MCGGGIIIRGIILGAGLGTRLYPSTIVCNKQLQILYDKPVIYYSISLLMEFGIKEIKIIVRSEDLNFYKTLLNDGRKWGISIEYIIQDRPDGIVSGVKKCCDDSDRMPCLICLGDNFIYQKKISTEFSDANIKDVGAKILCIKRDYKYLISTLNFDRKGKVIDIVRLSKSKGKYIVPGVFYYNEYLWEILSHLKDNEPWVCVNREYLNMEQLKVKKLPSSTAWYDVGVPEERIKAEKFIEKKFMHTKKKIGCPEEIALKNEWISIDEFEMLVNNMPNCEYKEYLENVLHLYSVATPKQHFPV